MTRTGLTRGEKTKRHSVALIRSPPLRCLAFATHVLVVAVLVTTVFVGGATAPTRAQISLPPRITQATTTVVTSPALRVSPVWLAPSAGSTWSIEVTATNLGSPPRYWVGFNGPGSSGLFGPFNQDQGRFVRTIAPPGGTGGSYEVVGCPQ